MELAAWLLTSLFWSKLVWSLIIFSWISSYDRGDREYVTFYIYQTLASCNFELVVSLWVIKEKDVFPW